MQKEKQTKRYFHENGRKLNTIPKENGRYKEGLCLVSDYVSYRGDIREIKSSDFVAHMIYCRAVLDETGESLIHLQQYIGSNIKYRSLCKKIEDIENGDE